MSAKKPKKEMTYRTTSPSQTFNLGKQLGKKLKGGETILLIGELGSGKTIFAKGLASGLGIKGSTEVTSPSFTLINEYRGRLKLLHIDLYRINHPAELYELGLEEIMTPANVVMVEWGEKLGPFSPASAIVVRLSAEGERKRKITISFPKEIQVSL